MAGYRVNLDIFAGPLDLLLYLIRKEEVDIYDISLSKITDQYIRYLDMLKSLDIDLAGDFLVMAATLMQIKSAMLLPKADPEGLDGDEAGDPRTELIRQLLEYKKFKDAANMLNDAAEEAKLRLPRPGSIIESLKPTSEPAFDLDQVNVWDLLEAFDSIMESTGPAIDISHITDDTPIDLYQIEILHRLQSEGPMTFERIFESRPGRLVMVGLFLALLELVREGLATVDQAKSSSSLYIKSLTDEPAEQAVQNAIIATAETIAEQDADEASSEQAIDETYAEQLVDEANIEQGTDEISTEQGIDETYAEQLVDETDIEQAAEAELHEEPPIAITELPAKIESVTSDQPERKLQTPFPITELPAEKKTIVKKDEELTAEET